MLDPGAITGAALRTVRFRLDALGHTRPRIALLRFCVVLHHLRTSGSWLLAALALFGVLSTEAVAHTELYGGLPDSTCADIDTVEHGDLAHASILTLSIAWCIPDRSSAAQVERPRFHALAVAPPCRWHGSCAMDITGPPAPLA